MDVLVKAVSCGFVSLVLYAILPADRKELKVLLGVVACCAIATAVASYLRPIFDFVDKLMHLGKLNGQMIAILWKIVGIGVVTEIASVICKDMENGTLSKMMRFLSVTATLWLTLPLFQEFIDIFERILEKF